MSDKGVTESENINAVNALGISGVPVAADKNTDQSIGDYYCENVTVDDGLSLPLRTKWDNILLMSALSVSQSIPSHSQNLSHLNPIFIHADTLTTLF
jgi:hypothetical protein